MARAKGRREIVARTAACVVLAIVAVYAAGAVEGCALVADVDFDRARLATWLVDGGSLSAGSASVPADETGCPADRKSCNGACVPKDDPAYGCGGASCAPCSLAHTTGTACGLGGACIPTGCEPGFGDCDHDPASGCEADLGAPDTCGSCTNVCSGGTLCAPEGCVADCPAPLVPCDGSCVNAQTSSAHCGGCGNACPGGAEADPACVGGTCALACRTGFADCTNTPAQVCAPLPKWYVDGDGDGYGTSDFQTGCVAPPGHAASSGDCLDTNAAVHPNAPPSATAFAGPNGPSFDYDCSGVEVEEDNPPHFPGSCSASCDEAGYIPAAARSGSGVNNYCGSTRLGVCYLIPNPGVPGYPPYSCGGTTSDASSGIRCR